MFSTSIWPVLFVNDTIGVKDDAETPAEVKISYLITKGSFFLESPPPRREQEIVDAAIIKTNKTRKIKFFINSLF
jgi:hypothetical protein